MKRLGSAKTGYTVAGHQDCGVCHPGSKGGRALDVRRATRLETQANGAVLCEHANEVPAHCSCSKDCYCKPLTCRARVAGATP